MKDLRTLSQHSPPSLEEMVLVVIRAPGSGCLPLGLTWAEGPWGWSGGLEALSPFDEDTVLTGEREFLLHVGGCGLTSQQLELWESQGLLGGCWAPRAQKRWWSQNAGAAAASRPRHLWTGVSGPPFLS